MAIKHLPNLRQGDDYVVEIAYNPVIDITGFKFYLTLKSSFDIQDDAAELQYSTVAGNSLLDNPTAGICFLTVPASVMSNVKAGDYYYDLQAITSTGMIETLLPPIEDYKFKLKVIPQVTRASS